MKTVTRYAKLLPATQRIGRIQLPQALVALGMTNVGSRRNKYARGKLTMRRLNEWQLLDLYIAAKMIYRSLVAKLHPDCGGSSGLCARLNALWSRIVFLFKRKGVEV